MKNKILIAVVIIIIFGFMILVANNQIGKSIDKISLIVKKDTLSNTGATFIFTNHSGSNLSYGDFFWIEKEEDGKWHRLEQINPFNSLAILYMIKAGEQKELRIDWEEIYQSLDTGKYRVVKEVSFRYGNQNGKKFYISAEFTIE